LSFSHRDLKPGWFCFRFVKFIHLDYVYIENYLITYDSFIKLIDFDFAKIVPVRTYTLCGTIQYLVPEILLLQIDSIVSLIVHKL